MMHAEVAMLRTWPYECRLPGLVLDAHSSHALPQVRLHEQTIRQLRSQRAGDSSPQIAPEPAKPATPPATDLALTNSGSTASTRLVGEPLQLVVSTPQMTRDGRPVMEFIYAKCTQYPDLVKIAFDWKDSGNNYPQVRDR